MIKLSPYILLLALISACSSNNDDGYQKPQNGNQSGIQLEEDPYGTTTPDSTPDPDPKPANLNTVFDFEYVPATGFDPSDKSLKGLATLSEDKLTTDVTISILMSPNNWQPLIEVTLTRNSAGDQVSFSKKQYAPSKNGAVTTEQAYSHTGKITFNAGKIVETFSHTDYLGADLKKTYSYTGDFATAETLLVKFNGFANYETLASMTRTVENGLLATEQLDWSVNGVLRKYLFTEHQYTSGNLSESVYSEYAEDGVILVDKFKHDFVMENGKRVAAYESIWNIGSQIWEDFSYVERYTYSNDRFSTVTGLFDCVGGVASSCIEGYRNEYSYNTENFTDKTTYFSYNRNTQNLVISGSETYTECPSELDYDPSKDMFNFVKYGKTSCELEQDTISLNLILNEINKYEF